MTSRCLLGARPARTTLLPLFTATLCGWLAAGPANGQDAATLSLDVAQKAWEAYHPGRQGRDANPTLIDLRQQGSVAKAVVRIGGRDRRWWSRRDPLAAHVYAEFLLQPNRTYLIDLDYDEPARHRSPNIDRSPEIIAEYNIELERLAYSPDALLLDAARADAFGGEAGAGGRSWLGGVLGSAAVFGQDQGAAGLRRRLSDPLLDEQHGGERLHTTPDAWLVEPPVPQEPGVFRCAEGCRDSSVELSYPASISG